ncbi:MAG: Gfo/Idh/MocA family oxidoreductase [Verrucomicrobiota bacterium]
MKTTRRSFIAKSTFAATALSASRVLGANNTIRVGLIGLGGRGRQSAKWFSEEPDTAITWLCDVEQTRIDEMKEKFPEASTTTDLRKLIEARDVDVIVISTCNHWHVLSAIWACESGKDVYVEKPISHNIWEGRQLVNVARRTNRIVQGGTQQRSDPLQDEIKDFLDAGEIGKAQWVRCNRYGNRASIGKRDSPMTPPDTVDYNLWLGPSQDKPIFREKFHYDWHWNFNQGNGELGNWGPHILDDLRNVVFRDKLTYPKRVIAGGGRFGWNDAGETPNTHFVYMDCGDIPVIMDVHNLPVKKGVKGGDVYKARRTRGFLVIECEGGYYAGGRGGGAAYDKDGEKIKSFKGTGGRDHAKNFLAAVRSRKRDELNAEIEEIHYSSAWCHLGNISWQLGDQYSRDEAEAAVEDFEPWNAVIDDFHNHLAANEITPDQASIKLGPMLEIDAQAETFTGKTATKEALALLTRDYRKGFEVNEVA